MHHRLLLGSTALVGASLLFAGAARAQDGGLEVILGGFTEFGGLAATDDTLDNQNKNQNYAFFMDNEIIVRVNGVTDGGINYGSKIEIEAGSDLDTGPNAVSLDEAGLFFSGNFGRVELGSEDGAEDNMLVDQNDAQAGTGGLDGDTQNLGRVDFTDTSDDIKATYFTPRIAGFQLGFSWTPDGDDNENGLGNTAFTGVGDQRKNIGAGGVNWVGVLGPVDLTLSATGLFAEVKGGNAAHDDADFKNNQRAFAVGGLLGFGGLSFGAGYKKQHGPTDDSDFDMVAFGLAYGFGPANVSVGYERDWNQNIDDANIFVVSGDLGVLPGVTLKGDVSYNTDDPFKRVDDDGAPIDSGSTLGGVVAIQLDY
jgi:outer membrane protein OmpU